MMQAMRANDKKLVEKLKKKESQITTMQTKMMKPQTYPYPDSFSYIIIWYIFLTPVYGGNAVAYVPGIGGNTCVHLVHDLLFFLRNARFSRNRYNAHSIKRCTVEAAL